MHMYFHVHDPRQLIFLRKSDCLGCAVLLCLAVCLTLLASFSLSSHLSLKRVHTHNTTQRELAAGIQHNTERASCRPTFVTPCMALAIAACDRSVWKQNTATFTYMIVYTSVLSTEYLQFE